MKKPILLILILTCWISILHSQQRTFSKVLTETECSHYNTRINAVVSTFDTAYILVGFMDSEGILLKLDLEGELVWNKELASVGNGIKLNGIERTNDKSYIVTGFITKNNYTSKDALCLKLDESGSIIWSKAYNFRQDAEFTSVKQAQGNGFVISGSLSNGQQILVSKINSVGELEWTRIMKAESNTPYNSNYASSIDVHEDGSIFITGYSEMGAPYTFHPFIIKLSASGIPVWSRKYASDITKYCMLNDLEFTSNGLMLHSFNSDETVLFETDTMGLVLWSKKYSLLTNFNLDGSKPKIHKTKDSSFVFIHPADDGLFPSFILKIDSQGNIIWDKYLSIDPIDVIETSNREYFIPGNRLDIALPAQETSNTCLANFGLIQIDSLGEGQLCVASGYNTSVSAFNLTSDSMIFLSSTGGEVRDPESISVYSNTTYSAKEGCAYNESGGNIENNHFQTSFFYPNPSSGIFQLKSDDNRKAQLSIVNCVGQRIYEASVSSQETKIDLQDQQDGIYFFRLVFPGRKSINGKLVVRK